MKLCALVLFVVSLSPLSFAYTTNQQNLWKKAKSAALKDSSREAIGWAQKLLKTQIDEEQKNKVFLFLGRVYFQMSENEKALKAYAQVKNNSDFWLEAQEESAWTLARQKKWPQALGQLQPVLNPRFGSQVFSEAHYLSAYINSKTCQYMAILKRIDQFKKIYKIRMKNLEDLKTNKRNIGVQNFWTFNFPQQHWSEFGGKNRFLPRSYFDDDVIYSSFKTFSQQSHMSSMKKEKVSLQFAKLARRDLKEIKKTIQYLKLVEADMAQKLFSPEQKSASHENEFQPHTDSQTISFPMDGEFWIDELKDYQVSLDACQKRGA